MKFLLTIVFFVFFSISTYSQSIKGIVKDSGTGEEIIGAILFIKNQPEKGASTGLDGSFSINGIQKYPVSLCCTLLGYNQSETSIKDAGNSVTIWLEPKDQNIGEVIIYGDGGQNTETNARGIERNAMNVVNVVSAKAIEISPDITVANVIQRVSGVTVERNSSGDGQYAILRGMDKRFNYTLVNGVKIPSPDNKNRFVPLDIFPAELLDRLEVTKSLTANMEGDGIGGAVNMVMKDAPTQRQLTANISTGYNSLFFDRDFQSFKSNTIDKQSPNEQYGLAYPVKMKDFTTHNLKVSSGKALPNLAAGFSYGDRFLKNHLGIMLAGSFQNSRRGSNSDMYGAVGSDGIQSITNRYFSDNQTRSGVHAKLDYRFSPNHKLMLYSAYMDFRNSQVRDAFETQSETVRLRWNRQTILNNTLKGMHTFFSNKLQIDWSGVYSKATNETPDNTQINISTVNELTWVSQNTGATRRWEHNSDEDKAGYLNLGYSFKAGESVLNLSAGGMYRDKKRTSFYNEYTFRPFDESKPEETQRILVRGEDWNNYDEIKFEVKEFGNLSDPLNYDASEKIGATYIQSKLTYNKLEIIAGLRAEHTEQGYFLKFPTEGAQNEGNQKYTDYLPSVHVKYGLHKDANLRFSYAKSLNRPSFFEIVPYSQIYEDYKERGNPDLIHTTAHNIDLRYEYFPRQSEQVMLGLFYKNIQNPIEFGMMSGFGQDTYYMPMNFGDAYNYGVEFDVTKYFSRFGIKANYTFTHSRITTTKMEEIPDNTGGGSGHTTTYMDQSRPLYGQAGHVVNFSLLYKDTYNGWDAQLAFSYTGERICIVSRYYNRDSWQAGYTQLDASVEKQFKTGLALFAKASNLTNSPMIQYVKSNSNNQGQENVRRYKGGVVERYDHYGVNMMLGMKYKF
ncbi:TonB-dependent receptor domain-containing protein [Dysgonomonas termitidis]|uniref:TonB-dependent receptor domain-containing protein n=1 Tax=Dysgonomonas termitidis TaxID=1516126 RepID=A0ABV9L372_9BACT